MAEKDASAAKAPAKDADKPKAEPKAEEKPKAEDKTAKGMKALEGRVEALERIVLRGALPEGIDGYHAPSFVTEEQAKRDEKRRKDSGYNPRVQ